MGADYELERSLLRTINIRRVIDTSAGSSPILGVAIPVLVHLEAIEATKAHPAGASQRVPQHWICTIDWPATLPGGPKYDDLFWMPGTDTNNVELGKLPITIETFDDPELGDVDHYEVTL